MTITFFPFLKYIFHIIYCIYIVYHSQCTLLSVHPKNCKNVLFKRKRQNYDIQLIRWKDETIV